MRTLLPPRIAIFPLIMCAFAIQAHAFREVPRFVNGFAAVDRYGTTNSKERSDVVIINAKGEIVHEGQFYRVADSMDFLTLGSGQMIVVENSKGRFRVTDSGDLKKEALPKEYHRDAAEFTQDKKVGLKDPAGNALIAPIWDEMRRPLFDDKMIAVRRGKFWGYVNRSGDVILDPQYDDAYPFAEAKAIVSKDGKTLCIDEAGKQLFEVGWDLPQYAPWVISFSDGMLPVISDGKWGAINENGELTVPCEWGRMIGHAYFGGFSDGLITVSAGKNFQQKYGYCDKSGAVVIEPKFDWAGPFSEGLAYVEHKGRWAFINKSGKVVIGPHTIKTVGDSK